MLVLFFLAAVLGDQVGYCVRPKVGPALFTRPDSKLFRQSHVTRAHDFLEKYGPKTIFLARFVPIVRTFAPIVAGVGKMPYRPSSSELLRRPGVGGRHHQPRPRPRQRRLHPRQHRVRDLVVVLLSLTPVFIEVYRGRKHRNDEGIAEPTAEPVAHDVEEV